MTREVICDYKECGLPGDSDHANLCILHIPAHEKNPDEFADVLRKKIEEDESNPVVETTDLSGVIFPTEVGFENQRFAKNARFRHAKFGGRANFENAQFENEADFMSAEFKQGADFKRAKFKASVNFMSACFSETGPPSLFPHSAVADFQDAMFKGNARFADIECRGYVRFSGAEFNRKADFSGARFNDKADFSGAKFDGRADFSGAEFDGKADFIGAKFDEEAAFYKSEFDGPVDFTEAEFRGLADFSGAEFDGPVDFTGAEFHGPTSFRGSEFHGAASFWGAEFDRRANFPRAEFHGAADFSGAKFHGPADFHGAVFVGPADFIGAEFAQGATFMQTTVSGALNFRSSKFPSRENQAVVRFNNVASSNAERIRFEDVDLSRVSFQRTDVSRIQFLPRSWSTLPEPRFWPFRLWIWPFWRLRIRPLRIPSVRIWPHRLWMRERTVIHDDVALAERRHQRRLREKASALLFGDKEFQSDLQLVAETYRQLRINFEASRREVEAGDFYVGQMEMRCPDPSYGIFYRFFLTLYRALGSYGEGYAQPLIWYTLIFAPLFALGYYLLGTVTYAEGLFSALTAGRLFQDQPAGIADWEKLLLYANILFDIVLLSLVVIALRRRFHR